MRLLPCLLLLCLLRPSLQWCLYTHFAETATINEVDVSSDGQYLLTASESKQLTLWNTSTFQPIAAYNINKRVLTAKFSRDQSLIAVGMDQNNVVILGVPSLNVVTSVTTAHGVVNEVDWSWDGQFLLTCGDNDRGAVYSYSAPSTFAAFWNSGSDFSNDIVLCRFARF